jgi:hypothetical protein
VYCGGRNHGFNCSETRKLLLKGKVPFSFLLPHVCFVFSVNTASRIETTCRQGCIHLSATTAKLLISSGKESWVEKRGGKVTAKGKGELTTYWLTLTQKADALKHLVRVREGIRDRGKNVYRNVFFGREAVDALVYNGLAKSRHDAVELARTMAKGLMLFRNETGKHTFGDDLHCYRFNGGNDLNSGSGWDTEEGKRIIESSDILKPSRLLAEQAEAFREGVDIRDRKYHMKTLKSCFIGSEAVDVLFFSGIAKSRREAIQIGQKLEKELRWFHSIMGEQQFNDSNNSFYRLRVPFEKRCKGGNDFDSSVRSVFSETPTINDIFGVVDDPESLSPTYSNGDISARKKMFVQLVKPLVGYHRVQMGRGHDAVFVGEGK